MAQRAGRARAALPVALALAAGLVLRLWMLRNLFEVNGDSLIYGGLAKNLLLHGRFALTLPSGEMYPTLIRLPGYPLFSPFASGSSGWRTILPRRACRLRSNCLAACCWRISCAGSRLPRLSRGAALATLWLAALCPFTASYAADAADRDADALRAGAGDVGDGAVPGRAGLGECAVVYVCGDLRRAVAARWSAGGRGFCAGASAWIGLRVRQTGPGRDSAAKAGRAWRWFAFCWRWRRLPCGRRATGSVFHVFEPLAPRLATDPGESPNPGWERWVKSWCLDFVSTYEIYWNVPGDKLDVSKLPSRAFDSPAQYAETAALAADYNSHGMELTPEIDARFERLAEERIAAHPLRYYVWLPLGRVADMWLRPRVENLPIDLDWWVYAHHHAETGFSWAYAGLNALYLMLGIAGLCMRPRFWGALLAYMLLRSALLLTVEAPEARYTLECFPMLFAAGGIALAGWRSRFTYRCRS